MGVDFIGRIGRNYVKHLDEARVRLGTADLFTSTPEEDRPTYPIDILNGAKLKSGQNLTVEPAGTCLIYRDILSVVARDESPPRELYQAVINSNSTAIAIVKEVHEISSVAEVSLW